MLRCPTLGPTAMNTPLTSLSLLKQAVGRTDAEAWQPLIDLYAPMIRAWLVRLHVPAQDEDDVAQEVFTALVSELPRFQHNHRAGAFRSWLRSITVNRVRNHWRHRRNAGASLWSATALDQLQDPHSDLARRWDEEHDAYVVRRLLELVKEECRPGVWKAFSRQVLDGETAETVAAELHTTVNAVLIAKSRVLRRLRGHAEGLIGESRTPLVLLVLISSNSPMPDRILDLTFFHL